MIALHGVFSTSYLFIGIYRDRFRNRIYVIPFPTLGFYIQR